MKTIKYLKKFYLVTAVCLASIVTIMILFNTQPLSFAASQPYITIDSHSNGESVPVGKVRLTGTYHEAINLFLNINGEKSVDVHLNSDGEESGTWSYDLNTKEYDGLIIIYAKGNKSEDRSGVSADMITLHVDNPKANKPIVQIVNPVDGINLSQDEQCQSSNSHSHKCTLSINVSVESKNAIKKTQVRINNGPWKNTKYTAKDGYTYKWKATMTEGKTYSIEARAIDVKGNIDESLTTYVHTHEGEKDHVTVSHQDRAIWIWENAAYNLFLNPGSKHVLKAFSEDTDTFDSTPIKTLYLAVGTWNDIDILKDQPKKVRNFLKWAHNNGFEVHATIAGGTSLPYLGALESYHDKSIAEIEKIINYNISSGKVERFDGVNIDIEPYIMPEFGANKPSIQLQYLDVLEKMIERRDHARVNLSIGPAIPRWYDTSPNATDITWKGETKPLSEHIQDISDYIAIMDYRDTADGGAGIIEQAQNEINYANEIGKPNSVVLGVETKDIASTADPEVVTFSEEGRSHMEDELKKVYAHYNNDDAFAGVAVHMYDSIKTFPSSWSSDRFYWTPPLDKKSPSKLSKDPKASTFNYQQIDLHFGQATDNMDVAGYNIYRSTKGNFKPNAANLVTTVKGLSYSDKGLLPSTKYYYKVAAIDLAHNEGPISVETSAKTEQTTLKPMIIEESNLTYHEGNAIFQLRVIDMDSNVPISNASIHGRFTYGAGKYISTTTNVVGVAEGTSEAVEDDSYQVGFQTDRVVANGYYWAYAADKMHTAEYNLLENPGFENELRDWESSNAYITSDEEDIYEGQYALTLSEAGYANQVISGIFPGNTYTLQGFAKHDDSDEGATIGIVSLDENGEEIPKGNFSVIIDSETYDVQLLTFTALPKTKAVKVYVKKNTTAGSVYIDDMSLKIKSLPDHQVLKR